MWIILIIISVFLIWGITSTNHYSDRLKNIITTDSGIYIAGYNNIFCINVPILRQIIIVN